MKKLFSLLLIVLLASPVLAQYNTGGYSFDRSNLYYGIRIGFNSSSISSDSPLLDASSARVGVSLGGVLGLRLSESHPTFLESGLYYIQKGGKGKGYNVSLNYLEVPVLIKYGFQSSSSDLAFLPFIGPYFSYAIGGKYKVGNSKQSVFNNGLYNHADVGFKLGCGFEYHMLYAELGYQLDVTDISDIDDAAHIHGFFLHIGVNF